MNIKDIKLGNKFELIVYNTSGEETKPSYVSQLEEVIDSKTILISAPIFEREIIPIPIATKIKIIFLHDKGLFSFKGLVKGREKRDNLILLRVTVISDFIKIQRREYFRLNWIMPVKIKKVQASVSSNESQKEDFYEVITKDISGGGVGLISNHFFSVNDIVELHLDLENKKICTRGKIVRSAVYDQDSSKYDIGIVYKGINMKDRDAIIKFIFDKQIKMIQKGLV
ncbi:MAG: hypothetical protein PWP27_114 [Clostridiales bacterium]|jgi:c-di-GMP-binding flagellar brake protein YcgR|nr:hypothetical protein [Clostridiales bacterium]MDK2932304.1 hypothetical protein [Clostridiales bacterium]